MTEAVKDAVIARLDPQALISQAIQAGAGIDTLERLVALATTVREVQAREAWYAAMAEFQRTCPPIKKTATAKIVTRGGGTYEYHFAPLDEIMGVIQPIMGPLGLSVSWRSKVEPKAVIVTCRVSHTLGHHEESGDIAMPVMEGESGANAAQRVGIAASYAKRYSLLGIIGKAPEDDDDTESQGKDEAGAQRGTAAADGAQADATPITEPQARKFWAVARGHGWTDDERHTLLTSLGVNQVEEIPAAKFEAVLTKLKAREAKLS